MRKLLFCTLLAAIWAASLHVAHADLIVRWVLTSDGASAAGQPAAESGMHVTGTNIQRGPGLTAESSSNSFVANGWETAANSDPALDQDYFSLGFSVADGFSVLLDKFYVATRSLSSVPGVTPTGYGPGTLGLFYSGDNFATSHYTFNQDGGSNVDHAIDLSVLGELTGDVEFRIIEIGNEDYNNSGETDATGRFRLFRHVDCGDVRLTGTVVAVPEPSAFWFGGFVCCVSAAGVASRRWGKARDCVDRSLPEDQT